MNRTPHHTTLDPLSACSRSAELDAVVADLSAGWAEGANPRAEAFAGRIAAEGPDALVELAYLEFCLAEAAMLAPDPEAYLSRFPEIRSSLARLLKLHGALDDSALQAWAETGTVALPEAGDEVGPYRLLRELGRGGLARVFLAEQADLDDRLVVLKVATRSSPEAILQARARHPHIVEILRQAQTGDGGLHLIAMPFLGGATLAAVLARASTGSRGLLAALDDVSAPEFLVAEANRSTSRDLLASSSRAKAAAWIVARLAAALDHASRLGVTHGDLKPANILIAADGRPMLFDFNLAAAWKTASEGLVPLTGGTLAYMAPERLRAMADPKSAEPPRAADRHRADLYSLGLVLREILTGRPPVVPAGAISSPREAAEAMAEARGRAEASLWSGDRKIPRGLRPVLARCLAPDPADRYARMSELAEDLDSWREGRPLEHAAEPRGPVFRIGRWAGRHRKTVGLAAGAVATAVVVAVAGWLWITRQQRAEAEAKLVALWDSGDPTIFRLRGLSLWKADGSSDPVTLARKNLDRYGAANGLDDWRRRTDVRSLGVAHRLDLESWLMEQAWRLASALADRRNSPGDAIRALAILESSPEWAEFAPFVARRQALRERLGLAPPPIRAREAHPSWLEQYARGLDVDRDHAREALAAYGEALVLRPEAFWPRYRAAVVAYRLGDYRTAVDHINRCLNSRPDNPGLLAQKAGCLLNLGDPSAAATACDRALARDPDAADAYRNRSLARARLGQVDAARADAARFAELTRKQGKFPAWEHRLALSQSLGTAVPSEPPPEAAPEDADAHALIAGWFELAHRTDDALAEYDKAILAEPDHLRARFGRDHLLRREQRNEGMYDMASLIEHPRYEELVRQDDRTLRAIHFVVEWQLRKGAKVEARIQAQRGLDLARTLNPPGSAESQMVAESRYALARALAPEAAHDAAAARRVADLLRDAGRTDRRILEDWYPRDSLFDSARKPINSLLK